MAKKGLHAMTIVSTIKSLLLCIALFCRYMVCILMEYCDGGDLDAAISAGVPFAPGQVAAWAWQVLAGLQHLHNSGTTHRDVKPANILLCGPQKIAKLCDFGLASQRDERMSRFQSGALVRMC